MASSTSQKRSQTHTPGGGEALTDLSAILAELLRIEGQKDSIEIGTPGRGGCVKVYGSFDDPEGFKVKLNVAFELRKYAMVKVAEQEASS